MCILGGTVQEIVMRKLILVDGIYTKKTGSIAVVIQGKVSEGVRNWITKEMKAMVAEVKVDMPKAAAKYKISTTYAADLFLNDGHIK